MKRPFGDKPKKSQKADAVTVIASGDRSIAIGGNVQGVVNSADGVIIVQVPPEELRPPAEVVAPLGLVKLPRPSSSRAQVGGKQPRVTVATHPIQGNPARALIVAAVEGAGAAGRRQPRHGTWAEAPLGPVGMRVASRAPCPVVVVHGS